MFLLVLLCLSPPEPEPLVVDVLSRLPASFAHLCSVIRAARTAVPRPLGCPEKAGRSAPAKEQQKEGKEWEAVRPPVPSSTPDLRNKVRTSSRCCQTATAGKKQNFFSYVFLRQALVWRLPKAMECLRPILHSNLHLDLLV